MYRRKDYISNIYKLSGYKAMEEVFYMHIYAYKRNSDSEDWKKVGVIKDIKKLIGDESKYRKLEITENIVAYKDEKFDTQYLFLSTNKEFVKQLEIGGETSFDELPEAIDRELQATSNMIYTNRHDPLDELNFAYNKAINYKRD